MLKMRVLWNFFYVVQACKIKVVTVQCVIHALLKLFKRRKYERVGSNCKELYVGIKKVVLR